jgi:hypothetical protein
MGWERRGSGWFYYRHRKQDGRVHKEYVGAGPAAEAAAREDARRRQARRAEALALRADRERWADADAALAALDAAADAAFRAALAAAGYRQHARCQWRKRRDTPDRG